jgi:hypothetical protein
LTAFAGTAQDTLPNFTVRNARTRIIIGWINPFPHINQITIQRSHDSLKNYKSILTVTDPKAIQNGFADTKAPNDHMFYRLFYAVEGGAYYFTAAKRPDSSSLATNMPDISNGKNTDSSGLTKPGQKKPDFIPSYFVYTNKEGYVFLNLPDADVKKYSIKFFEEDQTTPLFEIKTIKDKALTLDKANFYHAGWFFFELYNGEKLVEKNKFYLSKSF